MLNAIINRNGKVQLLALEGTLTWHTGLRGTPGKVEFKVIKDDTLNFTEGNKLTLQYNGVDFYNGFVFTKKRDKNGVISVTSYDQLRYLKNKNTYVYSNKTANEFIAMIAEDFKLQTGNLADTQFKIASRIEDNTTLIDMIQNALDVTIQAQNELYVIYDDVGKLTLSRVKDKIVPILISEDNTENFDYTTSIDGNTFNQIKLIENDSDDGKRAVYIAKDSKHINDWGVLQYFESIDKSVNGKAKADALLKMLNKKSRDLKVKNVLGDIRVRAGCMVAVALDLGDIKAHTLMIVESCTHQFSSDSHLMDLSLKGGFDD